MNHLTAKWFPRRHLNGYLAFEHGYVGDVRNVASSPAGEDEVGRLSCERELSWLKQQVELLSSHPPLFFTLFQSVSHIACTVTQRDTDAHKDTHTHKTALTRREREL